MRVVAVLEQPKGKRVDKLICKNNCPFKLYFRSAIDSLDKKATDKRGAAAAAATSVTENESFNRHYNKELKVSEGKNYLSLDCVI